MRVLQTLALPLGYDYYNVYVVAGDGFEPTTFWLWTKQATRLLYPAIFNGLSEWIWTTDILVPNQAFYQTELHLDKLKGATY